MTSYLQNSKILRLQGLEEEVRQRALTEASRAPQSERSVGGGASNISPEMIGRGSPGMPAISRSYSCSTFSSSTFSVAWASRSSGLLQRAGGGITLELRVTTADCGLDSRLSGEWSGRRQETRSQSAAPRDPGLPLAYPTAVREFRVMRMLRSFAVGVAVGY
jgi:hypothetical protein